MCCIYTIGATIFSLSSVSPIMTSILGTQIVGIGGILILGLSAGLMKAVYTSLGPDQFKVPEQRNQQQRYILILSQKNLVFIIWEFSHRQLWHNHILSE